jgi:hypothetical protein
MEQIYIIVKGDRHTAARAATERGIPLVFVREVRGDGRTDTCGHVPATFFDKVSAWFAEPNPLPYPPGTCLHFHLPGVERASVGDVADRGGR